MNADSEDSGKYYILTNYIFYAMREAKYSQLGDGSICGRIPGFAGLIAFAFSFPLFMFFRERSLAQAA